MTTAVSPETQCDECGCSHRRIQRIYKGRRFCSTCYARLFKRSLCPGCGNFGRLRVDDAGARCSRCISNAPCVRCNQVGKKVGIITAYGPVCSSCAHYFRTPEPCQVCGVLSTRLTRVLKLDPDLRCCPRCVRVGAATCPACRHHRFLVQDVDGQMRCRQCSDGKLNHCLSCARPIPAGRGKECEDCFWDKSFHRRVLINVEAFKNVGVRDQFNEFCRWLRGQLGANKAAVKLKHYLGFFHFLDADPHALPSYAALLEHFSADGLRRMQTPMRWLETTHGVRVDEALREEHSEKRRIEELIGSIPSGIGATAIEDYRTYLLAKQRDGHTTLRSVRLSLRAAKGVLSSASLAFDLLPTQKALSAYLTDTPGQRAAAQGFISFLNRTNNLNLRAEADSHRVAKARDRRLEAELLAMYANGGGGEVFERSWIKVALMLFHGVSRVNKKVLTYTLASVQGQSGFDVVFKEKTYWVPAPTTMPLVSSNGVITGVETPNLRIE